MALECVSPLGEIPGSDSAHTSSPSPPCPPRLDSLILKNANLASSHPLRLPVYFRYTEKMEN